MIYHFSKERLSPTRQGYFYSVLSLFILALLLLLIPLLGYEIKLRKAYSGLVKSLEHGSSFEIKKFHNYLFEPLPLVGETLRLVYQVDYNPEEVAEQTKDILNVIELLNTGDTRKAAKTFYSNLDSWKVKYKLLNNIHSDLEAEYKAFDNTLIEADKLFSEYETANNLLANQDRMILNLKSEQDTIRQQFNLLATDFADFFSLAKETADEMEGLLFYQGGVLAKLPRLVGLKDQIKDLQELKAALDAANGAVQLSGPEAPQIFQKRLLSLKTSAGELIEDFNVLSEQLEDLNNNRALQQQKLSGSLIVLRAKLNALLLSFTEQHSSLVKLFNSLK